METREEKIARWDKQREENGWPKMPEVPEFYRLLNQKIAERRAEVAAQAQQQEQEPTTDKQE